MIRVFVRHECVEQGFYLGEFPVSDIRELVELFKNNITFFDHHDCKDYDNFNIHGDVGKYTTKQFVSDPEGVYLEIIIEPTE